jgi:hypothetical protein
MSGKTLLAIGFIFLVSLLFIRVGIIMWLQLYHKYEHWKITEEGHPYKRKSYWAKKGSPRETFNGSFIWPTVYEIDKWWRNRNGNTENS